MCRMLARIKWLNIIPEQKIIVIFKFKIPS